MSASTFERHGMAILQAIITALLVWIGFSTVQVREDIARLQTQMADVVITRMDRQDEIITDHERRIRRLERGE